MVSLDEAKNYLRVDYADDDALILQMIDSAERLTKDAGRLTDEEFASNEPSVRIAVLYAIGYLYEHREEADHHDLVMTLRNLLSSVREGVF